jgi:hypothetical protein
VLLLRKLNEELCRAVGVLQLVHAVERSGRGRVRRLKAAELYLNSPLRLLERRPVVHADRADGGALGGAGSFNLQVGCAGVLRTGFVLRIAEFPAASGLAAVLMAVGVHPNICNIGLMAGSLIHINRVCDL